MKMAMNPFCEIALEEAVRLKEKKVRNCETLSTVGWKDQLVVVRSRPA